ncbi:MAG: LysR family transcriptional regulator [Deltaproteobacteria bacterium]|nr:LysR family transcriptional regulator [Deltaproteobacteria bacterium]
MEWLNFNHLLYFGAIAEEGSISKAGERLRLTHPTLSVQLRVFETFLGQPLFERRGRRLLLTPFGAQLAEFAGEAARLSAQVIDFARGRGPGRSGPSLRVGLRASLPKTIAYRLIAPAMAANPTLSISVQQGEFDALLSELATQKLHVVLADRAPPQGSSLRLHAHLLGETAIVLYGTPALARRYRKGFPGSLEGAPLLLPSVASGLRGRMDRWLAERDLRARVVAEIDDAGVLRAFGLGGRGLFPVRDALAAEIADSRGVVPIGKLVGLRERYYAISVERRVRHPAVSAIVANARSQLPEPVR